MQELVQVHKKERKQKKEVDDEILQSLKRTLEDLKAGRAYEVRFQSKKVKSGFPHTDKEIQESVDRAIDDIRKGRCRRVF